MEKTSFSEFMTTHKKNDGYRAEPIEVLDSRTGIPKDEIAGASLNAFMAAVVEAAEEDAIGHLMIGTPEDKRISILIYQSPGSEFDSEMVTRLKEMQRKK